MCQLEAEFTYDHYELRRGRKAFAEECDVCGSQIDAFAERFLEDAEWESGFYEDEEGEEEPITETYNGTACVECGSAMEQFNAEHEVLPLTKEIRNYLVECVADDGEGSKWKAMVDGMDARFAASKATR